MSASDGEMSCVGASNRHGCEVGDGEDDEDADNARGDHAGRNEDGKKHGFYGFRKDIGKAKQMALHQFTNAKKQFNRRNKRALRSSTGNESRNSGKGCYFCFVRPQVVESPNGSPISDPDDPSFTYAMLKTFIEKNDFYYKECNPHIG